LWNMTASAVIWRIAMSIVAPLPRPFIDEVGYLEKQCGTGLAPS